MSERVRIKERFRNLLVIMLVLGLGSMLTGGHLAVLQTAAWSTMVWKYSQKMSFFEALEETLGGNPCEMCMKVQDASSADDDAPLGTVEHIEKITPLLLATKSAPVIPCRPGGFQYPPEREVIFSLRWEEPLAPVPIAG